MAIRWSNRTTDAQMDEWRAEAERLRDETRRWMEPCRRFALFVGFQRSGHTLCGSLLDAHRHAMIGHELNALRFVENGFDFDALCAMIRKNVEETAAAGREQTGYQYAVPGQWQGRAEPCLVVGDKKGGATSRLLATNPEWALRLRDLVPLPLHVVIHVRNPFDNIATIVKRRRVELDEAIGFYATMCRGVDAARALWPGAAFHRVRLPELSHDPAGELTRLARFFGLEPFPDWLDACSELVWNQPTRTRGTVDWPTAARNRVENLIEEHPDLAGFQFDGD